MFTGVQGSGCVRVDFVSVSADLTRVNRGEKGTVGHSTGLLTLVGQLRVGTWFLVGQETSRSTHFTRSTVLNLDTVVDFLNRFLAGSVLHVVLRLITSSTESVVVSVGLPSSASIFSTWVDGTFHLAGFEEVTFVTLLTLVFIRLEGLAVDVSLGGNSLLTVVSERVVVGSGSHVNVVSVVTLGTLEIHV